MLGAFAGIGDCEMEEQRDLIELRSRIENLLDRILRIREQL
jgi:hypothetical protein